MADTILVTGGAGYIGSHTCKARLNLFNLLKEQKRYIEAVEQGYALERYDLPYPDLYCGLAETLLELSRYSDARQFAQKAISLNPAYPMALQVLQQIDEHGKPF